MAKTRKKKKTSFRVKLLKSQIGSSKYQRKVLDGLGLRHIGQIVEREDTAALRGMVAKVAHLVKVIDRD